MIPLWVFVPVQVGFNLWCGWILVRSGRRMGWRTGKLWAVTTTMWGLSFLVSVSAWMLVNSGYIQVVK
jgi:hypothetical protein